MSTTLTGCNIHVEQQPPSHIYINRFYQLSIYLKCDGVPKFLNHANEVKLITSIITTDTKQKLSSPHFIFDNPPSFKRSGDTKTKFKIAALSSQYQSYRIQCEIPNSPVRKWISEPFTVVQYKFAMTKQLRLIDGDKWYKDEGGKTNFLSFEIGLHNQKREFVTLPSNVQFQLSLVYFDDKSVVLNQNILRTDSDQHFILGKNEHKIGVRFKIGQVSSHHQKRRFCVQISSVNDLTVGPCLSLPILVLSKRNKPKKTPTHMSAQKRKEVATKKKNKKRKLKNHNCNAKEPTKKKRKLNGSDSENESGNASAKKEEIKNPFDVRGMDHKLCTLISDNKQYSNMNDTKYETFEAIQSYLRSPNTYFDHNYDCESRAEMESKQKRNLVAGLRLCMDTFGVLSGRAVYYGQICAGERDSKAGMVYECCFCHRFDRERPENIEHYKHCRVVSGIRLLKGQKGGEGRQGSAPLSAPLSRVSSVPLDNGPKTNSNTNSVAPKMEKPSDIINALLQNIPTTAFPANNNVDTNNFAAALNRLLQSATVPVLPTLGNGNGSRLSITNTTNKNLNGNGNGNGNHGFVFGKK